MVDIKTLAITFPGQGSQSIGMMAGFADMPVVERTFVEASDILKVNLWKMVLEGPEETLAQTVNTQPVMLTAGVATFRAWKEIGGPDAAVYAGHSLGEYTALVAAGALMFADALPLVRFRAEAMQAAVPEGVGGIAAILGLDEAAIHEVCSAASQGEVCEAVNLNSPGQIVIAGNRSAVARSMVLAKEKGAKRVIMLPMSVPSHCVLMKPAAAQLAQYLASVAVNSPSTPVIQNADVKSHDSPEAIRQALVEQLYRPVRWIETIQAIAARGMQNILECAPGKVLTGLNKRIAGSLSCTALTDANTLKAALQ
jgi:[acyl-carrier-protein] S-malonyltransferase